LDSQVKSSIGQDIAIDGLIYQLYSLNDAEIKIVDGEPE